MTNKHVLYIHALFKGSLISFHVKMGLYEMSCDGHPDNREHLCTVCEILCIYTILSYDNFKV